MLTFSFVIPTYNAADHLENCLKSIRQQQYPREAMEVLIADGGSSDRTLEIAQRYESRILENKKRLAEYGVQLGVAEAKGDLLVVFAADNELVGEDWAAKVSRVFEQNNEISAVWGRLASGPHDAALNKYFALIQSDPLSWFLNTNLLRYKKSAAASADYFEFKVDPRKPLVWGANGLVYRSERIKKVWQREEYLGDNDAFQYMVEQGNNKVAYFDTPFVYHHHVSRLSDWPRKWKRNLTRHLFDKQESRNMNWAFDAGFRKKAVLWVFYSVLPVFSFLHASYLALRERNIYWLYHPLASFLQAVTYMYLVVSEQKGRRLVAGLFIKRRGK
ncbi:MAG: glycosyltransferase [Candidatus Omnitrophica bacterium]|nr:glycosyltransferase [Candidatus Omnitrophota bacterium]